MTDNEKTVLDMASVFTVVGTLMDVIPTVAAIFTIIWTGVRIYETATVQKLLRKD